MISTFKERQQVAESTPPNSALPAAASPLMSETHSIACDIHDGFMQDALAAKMLLDTVLQGGRLPEGEIRAQIQQAADQMGKAIEEARRTIGGLRLPVLDELGAVRAIESLIDDLPPGSPLVRFVTDDKRERWNYATEVAVYRIVQQSLHNLCRHSRAEEAVVRLVRRNERLHLEIEDRGIGFDPASVNEDRFGLQGIRQRARLLNGRAVIESAPGKGTRIVVDLPAADALKQ